MRYRVIRPLQFSLGDPNRTEVLEVDEVVELVTDTDLMRSSREDYVAIDKARRHRKGLVSIFWREKYRQVEVGVDVISTLDDNFVGTGSGISESGGAVIESAPKRRRRRSAGTE